MNDLYSLNKDFFICEGDTQTPRVVLDKKQNKFEFTGNSLPENALSFYKPIIEWFELYKKEPNEEICVIFKVDYINSASSKMMHKIILKLDEIHLLGNQIEVKWYYQNDDEDMLLDGQTYLEDLSMPYQFLTCEMKH